MEFLENGLGEDHQIYVLIAVNRPHKLAGYDVTSYFQLTVIGVQNTALDAAYDGFGSNLSGSVVCLPPAIGELLVRQNVEYRSALYDGPRLSASFIHYNVSC